MTGQVRFFGVLYRKAGMTPEQFRRHLIDVHGPLAEKLPGLTAYRQHHRLPGSNRDATSWDALVELTFASRHAFDVAWDGPEGRASDADLPLFLDLERCVFGLVDTVTRL